MPNILMKAKLLQVEKNSQQLQKNKNK